MKLSLLLLLLISLLAAPAMVPAADQFGDSGLMGVVVDKDRRPMKGAVVAAKRLDGSLKVEVICDFEGTYLMTDLPAGKYKVTASLTKHGQISKNVTLAAGKKTTLVLMLPSEEDREGVDPTYQPTPAGIGAIGN
jgi:carboxypeptidase family protein